MSNVNQATNHPASQQTLSLNMTVKDLERALKAEGDSLQKVHSQVRVGLQMLQVRV